MKARLLPNLEQSALWNAVNMSFEYNVAQNTTVSCTKVNMLVCPSDGNVPSPSPTSTSPIYGYSSYPNSLGIMRIPSIDGPAYKLADTTEGAPIGFATITDGLSNTVIFSEFIMGMNGGGAVRGKNVTWIITLAEPSTAATYNRHDVGPDRGGLPGEHHLHRRPAGLAVARHALRLRRGLLPHPDPEQEGVLLFRRERAPGPHDPECEFEPRRRREHSLDGRLGPFRQGFGLAGHLVVHRHQVRRRDRLRRLLLNRALVGASVNARDPSRRAFLRDWLETAPAAAEVRLPSGGADLPLRSRAGVGAARGQGPPARPEIGTWQRFARGQPLRDAGGKGGDRHHRPGVGITPGCAIPRSRAARRTACSFAARTWCSRGPIRGARSMRFTPSPSTFLGIPPCWFWASWKAARRDAVDRCRRHRDALCLAQRAMACLVPQRYRPAEPVARPRRRRTPMRSWRPCSASSSTRSKGA